MKTIATCLFALVFLSGCATSNDWSVRKIDEPDGVVLISYDTDNLQRPPISIKKANNIATRHCELMGYSYTEKNVHGARQCSAADSAGACSLWQVDYEFQCGGNAVSPPDFHWTAVVPNFQAASRP